MIVVGTRFYESNANANGRQQRAREAIRGLEGVIPINLQFADETFAPEGFRTLPVLQQDSRKVSGGAGARMPIVSEMLDRLADVARDHHCRAFMFHNADIRVAQGAVDLAGTGDYDGIAFCRADLDPATGAFAGMMVGVDAVAFDLAWWTEHRRLFRPYISGPPCWDNVYAAVICSHGRGTIVTDRELIYHEQHPSTWSAAGAFAEYNGMLAALDAPYFSRWMRFVTAVRDARSSGQPYDTAHIVSQAFSGPLLSPAGRARHAGRQVLARLRYAWLKAKRREAQ
jgi:hypothetical protein